VLVTLTDYQRPPQPAMTQVELPSVAGSCEMFADAFQRGVAVTE
jgi:hypothetical protein